MNSSRLKILLVYLSIFIVSCSSGGGGGDSNNQIPQPVNGLVSITSPSAGSGLPNSGTLTVNIFIDGSAMAADSRTIDTIVPSVDMDISVPAGTHSFRMVFEYMDSVFGGPYEVGYADSAVIDVIAGSNHNIDFIATDYFYQDLDSDGVTNLAELHASLRTDPGDSTCTLDRTSILDSCTLG